jgi:hypothetical protein
MVEAHFRGNRGQGKPGQEHVKKSNFRFLQAIENVSPSAKDRL